MICCLIVDVDDNDITPQLSHRDKLIIFVTWLISVSSPLSPLFPTSLLQNVIMSSTTRPRTAKPRGICKYYTTLYGCLSGSSCKFLHGTTEQLDPRNPLLTPYDESKRCRFYAKGQSSRTNFLLPLSCLFPGFCRHSDQCWFKHIVNRPEVTPSLAREEEDLQNDPCSICFEKPATYGLLCTFP